MLDVIKEKAKQLLINECIESGNYYLDDMGLIVKCYCIYLYYHRNYARQFIFDNELAYELFLAKFLNGYKDYTKFAKENDYNMVEKLESIYTTALL